MMKHAHPFFPSDIFLMLETAGAQLNIGNSLPLSFLPFPIFCVFIKHRLEPVAAGTQYKMVLGKQNFVSEANKFLPQTSWGMEGAVSPPLGSRGKAPGKL